MDNLTSPTTFLLLEFSDVRELQILHLFAFLILYLTSLIGNLLIIVVIALDHHLHTPMYFFLMNLAIMDLGSISVSVPKSVANSLLNTRSISYSGCVAQVLFFVLFEACDLALLTVMAHDRYVAICNPLQYEIVMHKVACIQMAVTAWMISLFYAAVHTGGTFAVTFCSNIVEQFFCEIPQLLKLSCSNFYVVELWSIAIGNTIGVGCFIFIIVTYVQIFLTVLRIPSLHGKKKALSTCLPHLLVISVFIFSVVFAYAKPPGKVSSNMDMAFAMVYAVTPPILNPFIYSIRNKEIKSALWKLLSCGISSIYYNTMCLYGNY
ncbi:olfactory receptor 14I1-like [Python bivittatus]|uniref:Olfactory receptor 14I1-like n=1 Tax=Python bivittatus TaxID=176946 RepID=A0A9F2RAK9_PYTBI|nr:olfactory receptor 14I1-like [Python bivittatus]